MFHYLRLWKHRMPGKSHPEPPLNPFFSRLRVSYWQRLKMILLMPIVIVRVLGLTFFMLLSVLLTYIGLICLPPENIPKAPLSTWRRVIRLIIGLVTLRGAFFCVGFHWVRTFGKRATRSAAPILVVAPHSSYFDPFTVTQCGEISVMAKEAVGQEFITGRILNFFQPIYVNREDANERRGAANRLVDRVRSPEDFPQVFIYPEGTTTNRSCLVQYKPGAFRCRKPVQPVLIRFPNHFDCITWTWDSPSLGKTIFYTICQLYNRMEVEFLPIYHPSEAELNNASLYASNLGKLMSEALGIPMTNYTLDDGKTMERMSFKKVRKKLELIWIIKGKKDELFDTTGTSLLMDGVFTRPNFDWNSSIERFTLTIIPPDNRVPDDKTTGRILKLFNLFKGKESDNSIDLRPYCFLDLIMFSSPERSTFQNIIRLIFRAYAGTEATNVSREVYGQVVKHLFEEDEHNIDAQFFSPDSDAPIISYSDFSSKIFRRIEHIKLTAMDVTGQIPGDYPKFDQKDHPRERMNFHE